MKMFSRKLSKGESQQVRDLLRDIANQKIAQEQEANSKAADLEIARWNAQKKKGAILDVLDKKRRKYNHEKQMLLNWLPHIAAALIAKEEKDFLDNEERQEEVALSAVAFSSQLVNRWLEGEKLMDEVYEKTWNIDTVEVPDESDSTSD
jgi:hypothetical protein